MIRKNLKYIWIITICIIAIGGCSKSNNKEKPAVTEGAAKDEVEVKDLSTIENDLIYLTSDECAGRKPGTAGNELAGDYIANRFKEIGLIPLEESYFISYSKDTEILNEESLQLEILDGETVIDTFDYGEDYIESFLQNSNLNLPLLDKPGETDCAIYIEDISKAQEYLNNPNVKLILKRQEKSNKGGYFYSEGNIPQLNIFPEAYEKLAEYKGNSILFSSNATNENMEQSNVAGIIKGKDSRNAIVISAHFDHVGSAGSNIWRGALDNASGVCTLLETAREVLNLYSDEAPLYDIIFSAFNSEENRLSGSYEFVKYMDDSYENYFNINVDCVGNKNYTALFVHENESEVSAMLSEGIAGALLAAGVTPIVKSQSGYTSDQENFTHGIALTTISDITKSNIHTLEDTVDKIDINYLEALGKNLGSYIVNNLDMDNLFTAIEKEEEEKLQSSDSFISNSLVMSQREFEDQFKCKLDFADDTLNMISLDSYRPVISDPSTPFDINSKLLEDLRRVTLQLDTDKFYEGNDIYLSIESFRKDNGFEMEIKEWDDAQREEYTKIEPFTIKDVEYYLSENNEGYFLSRYELDDYYVNVYIFISSFNKTHEELTREETEETLQNRLPYNYIDGMLNLLFP